MGKDNYPEEIELGILAKEFQETRHSNRYSEAFKRSVVRQILVDHVPVLALSKKIGVPRYTIYVWLRKFAAQTENPLPVSVASDVRTDSNPTPMSKKKQESKESPEEELARLREENKRLQEALKMSEWMNHAKDVMIDQAEKTFNIPIRKKSGAKQ